MNEFIKKYWPFLLVIVIALVFIVYQQIQLKKKNSIIYYQDSLIVLDSTKYQTLAKEYINEQNARADLERYSKGLVEIIDKKKEEIRTYIQVIAKLKKQNYTKIDTLTVFKVKNDTIYVPVGDDRVEIDVENSLYRIYGETFLYPDKGYNINFEGKPITLDVVVTEDNNGVFNSYIETNNPDLETIKFSTKVLQDVSFWKEFYSVTSLSFTTQNVMFDLGVGYNRWGIKGLVGIDHIGVDKKPFYGVGLTFKIF